MNKSDNETSIPYDPSNVTTLGDDLFQIADKVPFFTYSILMLSFSIISAYVLFFVYLSVDYNWLLDNMCGYFSVMILVFGVIILIGLASSIKVLRSLSGKILPIRLKLKLELIPVMGNDPISDLFDRLKSCFLIKSKNNNKYLKTERNKNGNSHAFDIYYEKTRYLALYIFVFIAVILFLLLLIYESTIYTVFSPIALLLLLIFIVEFIAFNILLMLRTLYKRDLIIVKLIDRKVTEKDIARIKDEYELFISKSSNPLLLGIVSTKGFSKEGIKYVKNIKGRAHNKHQISLLLLEKSSFRIIWT